jgi:hypothetical protein
VQCDSACCKHCGLQEMGVAGNKRGGSFACLRARLLRECLGFRCG